MSPIVRSFVLSACFSLALVSPAFALDVHTVAADGLSDFKTVQDAVDAAANGDVIVVRGGNYPAAITIDAKSLWIARVGVVDVRVGPVTVRNLAAEQRVLLAGLSVRVGNATRGLVADDNAGHLHVSDCTIVGGLGAPTGVAGVELTNCRAATFVRCTITGGDGIAIAIGNPEADGGPGLVTDLSTPALYDCTVTGGDGPNVWLGSMGGRGGPGAHVETRFVFASSTRFVGGNGGGSGSDDAGEPGGDGGAGVVVDAGAAVQLFDSTLDGGDGGDSFFGPEGADGPNSAGAGAVVVVPGESRLVRATLFAPESSLVELSIHGVPGDRVYFGTSLSPDFVPVPTALGFDLLANGRFGKRPVAIVPPSGNTTVLVPMAELDSAPVRPLFAQAVFRPAGGGTVLSGPTHVLVANCPLLAPDCNGNGSSDLCDLANGSSSDTNGNDLPDECEFEFVTHVDDDAAPGGNGSALQPYRTIAEGVAASPEYQVVRIHDGVYTSAQNRGIDLTGRALLVESANGSANCTIDLQNAGTAFVFSGPPGVGGNDDRTRIRGLKIVNGNSAASGAFGGGISISRASPTIENCRFENCTGTGAGAIYADQTKSAIVGCTFVGNHAVGVPGAVRIGAGGGGVDAAPRVLDCYFYGNSTTHHAGALYSQPSTDHGVIVSHCTFLANTASVGGAISTSGLGFQSTRIENCLIAGNVANHSGGGVFAGSNAPRNVLRNCTIVDNVATVRGGGVSGGALLDNDILWGNTAPAGAQLSVSAGSTATVVRRSDLQGREFAVEVTPGTTLTWGAGNIASNPQFVDADGADDDAATLRDNDYRLAAGSPCVGAGDNALVPNDVLDLDGDANTSEGVPFDLDFLARIVGAIVEMGAYERQ